MDISLFRHSISESNTKDVISGAGLDTPLAVEGIAFAQKVSQVFDTTQFDTVYASPLSRAYDTAEILTETGQPIVKDDRLKEIYFGAWEEQDPEPLRQEFPDAFDYFGMLNANYSKYAKNSESYPDLIARVSDFLDEMKAEHAADNLMIVCHGMTIRAIFAAIFKNDIFEYSAVDNVSLSRVHLDEKENFRPRIECYNRILAKR